jgi:hypothetical protein
MIKKIISGGQTGADRAALDTAIKLGIHHGGWISKGRKAEALSNEPSMTSNDLWRTATDTTEPSCPPKLRKSLTEKVKSSLNRAYNLSFMSYNSCTI